MANSESLTTCQLPNWWFGARRVSCTIKNQGFKSESKPSGPKPPIWGFRRLPKVYGSERTRFLSGLVSKNTKLQPWCQQRRPLLLQLAPPLLREFQEASDRRSPIAGRHLRLARKASRGVQRGANMPETDGENSTSADMRLFLGFQPCQVVQDFTHQQHCRVDVLEGPHNMPPTRSYKLGITNIDHFPTIGTVAKDFAF